MSYVYFPTSGMISLLRVMNDRTVVEDQRRRLRRNGRPTGVFSAPASRIPWAESR